jgi:hypothetical protein
MPKGEFVSIYLDCLDRLGAMDIPYWAVYPLDGEIFRCGIKESKQLLTAIKKAVDILEQQQE